MQGIVTSYEALRLFINQFLADQGIIKVLSFNEFTAILTILVFSILMGGCIVMGLSYASYKRKYDEEELLESQSTTVEEPKLELVKEKAIEKPLEKVIPWSDRLKKGLSVSRKGVWGKLSNMIGPAGLDEDTLDEIEELLYSADIGGEIVSELIEKMNIAFKAGDAKQGDFNVFLKDFIRSKMKSVQDNVDKDLYRFDKTAPQKTKVIMIVGVNGAGKTTTIGKLATKLTGQGAKVVIGACDTFRAAAVDQLEVWCERAGAQMVRAKEGANPSGVGYDALKLAINEKADYCILDTAGRLHTKSNLMDELTKSKSVLTKLDASAPHQTLLVIDAITGQNALRQAEEFNKALELTGLIFTKCDGSSKAGSAIGIVDQLQVPITYIGVGEDVQDLNEYDLEEYLNALLDS